MSTTVALQAFYECGHDPHCEEPMPEQNPPDRHGGRRAPKEKPLSGTTSAKLT